MDLGISFGEYYILKKNQIITFKEFWNSYNNILITKILDYKRYDNDKYIRIKIAMENFIFSYAKKHGTDIYIDCMNSLFALLFKSNEYCTNDILLTRRCANLLEESNSKRIVIINDIKILYQHYQKIINGEYIQDFNILKLREYLKRSLIKYMDKMKSESFSHAVFINSIDNL